jgi:hypothetical protein
MNRSALRVIALAAPIATLILFPWSGKSTQCADLGPDPGCVTEYMSPFGLRYPDWLGGVFYFLLLCLIAWIVSIPFRRLDRRAAQDRV